jgi:farnesyl-diphosphate farnesyltransferase
MAADKSVLRILPDVSRTFAISVMLLRQPLRGWVAQSYLLCRMLDTFEDDTALSLKEKDSAFAAIQEAIRKRLSPDLKAYVPKLASPEKEIELIARADELFELLYTMPEPVFQALSVWAVEMAEGMKKFAITSDNTRARIQEMADLDQYCYYVAGTVGNMLTEIFRYQTGKFSGHSAKTINKYKENFGKALQLVNIIKDSPSDYLEKRCYLPQKLFANYNLSKQDFFGGKDMRAVQDIYYSLLSLAEKYLDDARLYINALPRRFFRIRLFCIIPVLLARKTLDLIKQDIPALLKNPGGIKIPRRTVRSMVRRSYLAALSNSFLNKLLS